ncbi:MAG: aryl-sulfate sulfotransferase [Bacteroidales bacterium]|nr:aryl-sulfate sulfotransferase [Bacteroidales bacterium]MBN2764020.1 aryl-sulfate sulfotransferase [Bacteroidales bacterium]
MDGRITLLLFTFLLSAANIVLPQEIVTQRYQFLCPQPGSFDHNPETEITVRYGEKIDRETVWEEFISVEGEISGKHKGYLKICDDLLTLIFKPNHAFACSERVFVSIRKGLKTESGKMLPAIDYWFTIKEKLKHDLIPDVIDLPSHRQYSQTNVAVPFDTGSLLFDNLFFCNVMLHNNPAPGYFFSTLNGVSDHYIIAFDNNGVPVYAKKMPELAFNFKPQPKGQLSYYDLSLEAYIVLDSMLDPVDTLTMKNGYTPHTHEALILGSGHVLLFAYDPQLVDMSAIVQDGDEYATVTGLVIQELDRDKNLIFQWRSWDHMNITDSYADLLSSAIDYVHGNSLDADTDTTLILSSRNLSEVTKINRLNGNIIWRLGGRNNEFSFVNDARGFSMQHSAARLKNGNLILFDNGVGFSPAYSRGIEYSLDEGSLIAELIYEFRFMPDLYTHIKGNIQRTDNGNTLVYWGHLPYISEFDPSGNITYNATFASELYPNYRVYKAEWKPGLFTFSADTLNFGQVYQGESANRFFDIINHSDRTITITSIHCKEDFSIIDDLPVVISSGQRKTISISFAAVKPGLITDVLNICHETDSMMVNRQLYVLAESIPNTGIEDFSNLDVSVYQNPMKGTFHLKLSQPGKFHIRIFNVNGEMLLGKTLSERDSYTVDLLNKPDGLYLIELYMVDYDIYKIFKIIK